MASIEGPVTDAANCSIEVFSASNPFIGLFANQPLDPPDRRPAVRAALRAAGRRWRTGIGAVPETRMHHDEVDDIRQSGGPCAFRVERETEAGVKLGRSGIAGDGLRELEDRLFDGQRVRIRGTAAHGAAADERAAEGRRNLRIRSRTRPAPDQEGVVSRDEVAEIWGRPLTFRSLGQLVAAGPTRDLLDVEKPLRSR